MNKIPIVFIHKGFQEYVRVALHQAKSYNLSTDIILIGDEDNSHLSKICKHYTCEEFENETKKFDLCFKHFSTTNSFAYEYFCLQRWFILLEFMKVKKLNWVFSADTDVLIYGSVNVFFNRHLKSNNYEAAFCIPNQLYSELKWVASGHTCFISQDFLEKFCSFILNIYESNINILTPKIDYHIKKNNAGGISDMTFFYLYYYQFNKNILNLLENFGGKIYNSNVGIGNNNEISIDKIFWKRNLYFQKKPCYNNLSKGVIIYESLHLHGGSKFYIKKFYSGFWFGYNYKKKFNNLMNKVYKRLSSFLFINFNCRK